jgi:hypothetical protein
MMIRGAEELERVCKWRKREKLKEVDEEVEETRRRSRDRGTRKMIKLEDKEKRCFTLSLLFALFRRTLLRCSFLMT